MRVQGLRSIPYSSQCFKFIILVCRLRIHGLGCMVWGPPSLEGGLGLGFGASPPPQGSVSRVEGFRCTPPSSLCAWNVNFCPAVLHTACGSTHLKLVRCMCICSVFICMYIHTYVYIHIYLYICMYIHRIQHLVFFLRKVFTAQIFSAQIDGEQKEPTGAGPTQRALRPLDGRRNCTLPQPHGGTRGSAAVAPLSF